MKFFGEHSAAWVLVTGLVFLLGLGLVIPDIASAKIFKQIATGIIEGNPGDGLEAVAGGGGGDSPPESDNQDVLVAHILLPRVVVLFVGETSPYYFLEFYSYPEKMGRDLLITSDSTIGGQK